MLCCVHCNQTIDGTLLAFPPHVRVCDACVESIRVRRRPLAPADPREPSPDDVVNDVDPKPKGRRPRKR